VSVQARLIWLVETGVAAKDEGAVGFEVKYKKPPLTSKSVAVEIPIDSWPIELQTWKLAEVEKPAAGLITGFKTLKLGEENSCAPADKKPMASKETKPTTNAFFVNIEIARSL
jgi:hypothetical protein